MANKAIILQCIKDQEVILVYISLPSLKELVVMFFLIRSDSLGYRLHKELLY